MKAKAPSSKPLVAAVLFLVLCATPAPACTWAAFANATARLIVRTMDWTSDDGLVVRGYGRGMAERTADTPQAVEYTSRYASIRFHSFEPGYVCEAMNEAGLQGSILYLDGSTLPPVQPGRPDVHPANIVAYAVANFATVAEALDSLRRVNILPAVIALPDGDDLAPENWPCHYAFADATGDRAIVEFVGGAMKIYHGEQHDVLTNEPSYDIHLAIDDTEYRPGGGIGTVERRMRARAMMKNMRERGLATHRDTMRAMRGVLAAVWSGMEQPDPVDGNPYPTFWGTVADQEAGRYMVSHIDSWCTDVYDFTMFDPASPEAVTLSAPACPVRPLE